MSRKIDRNIPKDLEYLTRSNSETVGIIKVERKGNMIKKTEFSRPYSDFLEKYMNEPDEQTFLKLQKQWENQTNTVEE